MRAVWHLVASAGLLGGIASVPCRADPVMAAAPDRHGCGDFLAQAGRKPARLVYVRCVSEPTRQGKPLRAIYRVSGAFAAAVEADLVKSVGLNRLRRSCCQWDGPVRRFTDPKGREFSIVMTSDETSVTSRRAWKRIPSFEVIVETNTEEI